MLNSGAAMMTRSDAYAAVQTLLLVFLNVIFFLVPGPWLFTSRAAFRTGTIVCGAGVVLLVVSLVTLRRVIQIAPAPRAGGHLVAAGVYRYLRHPIYTAMAAIVAGLFLRRPTLAFAIAGAVVIGFLLVKAGYEESLLRVAYPEYDAYRARTRGVLLTR
jgi:protein-S-isoprenylcysteine O-methyltransferase Ste14